MGQKLWEGNKAMDKGNVFTIHCLHISNRKTEIILKSTRQSCIDILGVG